MKTSLTILIALLVCAVGGKDIQLAWDHTFTPEQGPVSYRVYWAKGTNAFTLYTTTPRKTVTVTNLVPGSYKFRVTATNFWEETAPSHVLTTPESMTNAPSLVLLLVLP